jgi:hypothetical protein
MNSVPLTDQQIRETITRMEAESAAAPLARRAKRTTLLKLALQGDSGARFVVFHNAVRLGVVAS